MVPKSEVEVMAANVHPLILVLHGQSTWTLNIKFCSRRHLKETRPHKQQTKRKMIYHWVINLLAIFVTEIIICSKETLSQIHQKVIKRYDKTFL